MTWSSRWTLHQGMNADAVANENLEGGLYGQAPAEYKHREPIGIASVGWPDVGWGNSSICLAPSR